ncbi:MAG TPA: crosslink repair DNA glycosylase YcaQ family protein [Candidatus Polarisedimenticolaceae bacterium]|nr:crosslink repair DNA glycosylase YcaQ family protein [Candidatus Polarisedimenticolaceae bacterium]
MDDAKIRAWWSHRQGLDGSLEQATASDALDRSGWARSVGGVGPYLTLFSRAGIGREAADQAVSRLQIHELPAARGCTYVVPASDFALALKVGQPFGDNELRVASKLGVTDKEVDRLCEAIVKALARGPLDPEAIRDAAGGAVRNLGEAGKKTGLITTLPVGLGRLQALGEIRRVPSNGRLDQQRYQYTLWRPNPLSKFKPSAEEANSELARRFFRWIAPATLAEFQGFSALGVKASRAAVEPLGLVPLERDSEFLIFPEDLERFAKFKPPTKPRYVLVSGLDAISGLRRNVEGLLDAKDAKRKVLADRDVKPLNGLADLPNHAILDRGRLVGLWEYDTETESIAWTSFIPKDKTLTAAVEATERYVREQLGDARSFSLDSPKSRVPRIAALRKA